MDLTYPFITLRDPQKGTPKPKGTTVRLKGPRWNPQMNISAVFGFRV